MVDYEKPTDRVSKNLVLPILGDPNLSFTVCSQQLESSLGLTMQDSGWVMQSKRPHSTPQEWALNTWPIR